MSRAASGSRSACASRPPRRGSSSRPAEPTFWTSNDQLPRERRAPMVAQASWLHGHAMEVEYRNLLTSERRAGYFYGVEGSAGSENWLHLAIPTPVIVGDRRLKVGSVMV